MPTFAGMRHIVSGITAIWHFYREGFSQMTWGRTLWIIIGIKLIVFFVILRLFFFQPTLKGMNDEERQEYVGRELIDK